MHRFPDRAGFDVFLFQGFHDLERLHRAVEGEAGEPIVGLVPVVDRLEMDAFERTELSFVEFVDVLFLGHALVEDAQLAAADAGVDVAHAVVVADLGVLVVSGLVAGLGRPEARLGDALGVFADQHATTRGRDDLVPVKREDPVVAKGARRLALVGRAEALGRILDQGHAMFAAEGHDRVEVRGKAIEMDHDHRLDLWVFAESLRQRLWVHVPGLFIGVDEDRDRLLVNNRIGRRGKGQALAEDDVPRPDATGLERQVDRRRARGIGGARLGPDILRQLALEFGDILAQ